MQPLTIGLSPLARGTPSVNSSGNLSQRFIPARAGNSGSKKIFVSPVPVYPRSRGELFTTVSRRLARPGLSPLARGTLKHFPSFAIYIRFIPARAGNSVWFAPTASGSTVYPRSRGELHCLSRRSGRQNGLSPLARGTLDDLPTPPLPERFIPARAGNSLNITYY